MLVCFNHFYHLLGESRYRLNGTPTAAHCGVATPGNRVTIPRRRAPHMDVQVLWVQDVQARPLLDVHGWTSVVGGRMPGTTCTTVNAPFNLSNYGF